MPKPDIDPAHVHETDPMTPLHLNTTQSLTPGFLCPSEAVIFPKLVWSLREVKVSGQIHPQLLKPEFTGGRIKPYPTNKINLNLDSAMLTQGLGYLKAPSE